MENVSSCIISELFFSIQGESSWSGLPCVFIRLCGCNLDCVWCDTIHAREEKGRLATVDELVKFTEKFPTFFPVEITGGEPLLQSAVHPLMAALLAAGRIVLLETNGSIPLNGVPSAVVKIMDVKCPGSGMHHSLHHPNLDLLTGRDQIKFVLAGREDYEWALAFINDKRLTGRELLFSAVPGLLPAQELAEWILADYAPVRLQLQLHKILWPQADRGK